MPGQDRERQARLRQLLLENKRRLWNELRDEVFRDTGEQLHSQFDIPQDLGEQSMVDVLEDTGLAVADIRRQELTDMDEAMGRLERGTYGVCDGCGEEIDEKRLKVAPFARYCLECQKRREGPPSGPGVTL